MTKRILVTGSRNWDDYRKVVNVLTYHVKLIEETTWGPVVIVHGGARGADKMAGRVGRMLGVQVEEVKADWERHGKAAGHIRNDEMVKLGADICIAFIQGESPGATSCANKAEKAGITTKRFHRRK